MVAPVQSASWTTQKAELRNLIYAARALALEKSATTTLLLALNLFRSLITENSARTRNLSQPNTLSNPKRPHRFNC